MIVAPENPKNYCIVCNEVAIRTDLSARAKGIYYYIATLPSNWKLSQQECMKHFTEGREAFKTAFKELVDNKYIIPEKIKNEKGFITGIIYKVLWTSQHTDIRETGEPENRTTGKPSDGKPDIRETGHPENQLLINTDNNNYPLKELFIKESSSLSLTKEKEKNPKQRFAKPTSDECIEYFKEQNSGVIESDRFYDYYEANGWIAGKVKMKDWKASARNWIRRSETQKYKPQIKQKELFEFEKKAKEEIDNYEF